MGWVRVYESTRTGAERFTAYIRNRQGVAVAVGTHPTEKKAIAAWHAAEQRMAEGRLADPRRGRQKFAPYVLETWRPHHVIEATTSDDYDYRIPKYLIPWFGKLRMNEISSSDVREWQTWMRDVMKVKPATIMRIRNILSAIFSTALTDDVIFVHPCHGVKPLVVPEKPRDIATPEQFEVFYSELPNDDVKLLTETDIETGARWGELTEFRVKDWTSRARTFLITRVVVKVRPELHDGQRFIVKEYPKGRRWRRVKVSAQLGTKIDKHIADKGLQDDDLLFSLNHFDLTQDQERDAPDPDLLGLTEPNEKGRQYKHGTLTAYNMAPCHCLHCRAVAAAYRASRRANGLDQPRKKRRVQTDEDGHIPNDWFRQNITNKALKAAGLSVRITPQRLRHAHASWALAGGAPINVVKERLGHRSIVTTEKYLHTLPDADETAVDAFATIRGRSMPSASPAPAPQNGPKPAIPATEPKTAEEILAAMATLQAQLGTMLSPG